MWVRGQENLRSETLLRVDLAFGLKVASKLDIWIELGGMFSWVEMDDKVSWGNGRNYATLIKLAPLHFFHAFELVSCVYCLGPNLRFLRTEIIAQF